MKSRSSWLLVGCWLVAGLLLGCWVAGRLLGWPMVLSTSDCRAQSGFEAIGTPPRDCSRPRPPRDAGNNKPLRIRARRGLDRGQQQHQNTVRPAATTTTTASVAVLAQDGMLLGGVLKGAAGRHPGVWRLRGAQGPRLVPTVGGSRWPSPHLRKRQQICKTINLVCFLQIYKIAPNAVRFG